MTQIYVRVSIYFILNMKNCNFIFYLQQLPKQITIYIFIETFIIWNLEQLQTINTMAFVFSEPRWNAYRLEDTPGPGSHCPPDITNNILNKAQHSKPKLYKGKAFKKYRQQQPTPRQQHKSSNQLTNLIPQSKQNKNKIKKDKILLISKQIGLEKNKQNMAKHFEIKISSLQHQIANNGEIFGEKCDYEGKSQKKQEICMNDFQRIRSKKTQASIKAVSEEQFYIGSKDELTKKKCKTPKQSIDDKKEQKFRIRCSLNNNQVQSEENFIDNPLIEGCQMPQKLTFQSKPISAKHPFDKKIINEQKYEENSTGIQDDESEQSQFMFDAVPGPGSYQIGSFSQSTKKCLMFTQKNKARFSDNQKQNICNSQFIYSSKPLTSQSKSRASQKKVGFGRSVVKNSVNKQSVQPITAFYQNIGSIENKCLKNKLKDTFNPGFFTSKASRFPQQTPKLSSEMFKFDFQKQNQIKKVKKIFYEIKPTHPFSSGVQRKTPQLTQIFDVSYKGQQYKTIDNNLKKLMSQPKYLFEFQDEQMTPQQREDMQIELKKTEGQKRIKSDIEIKHQLIESLNGFRQRQKKITRKRQMKGYTFNLKEGDIVSKQHSPEPGRYHHEPQWIKNSFNLRFAQGYSQEKYQQQGQNQQLFLKCQSEAIKIIGL